MYSSSVRSKIDFRYCSASRAAIPPKNTNEPLGPWVRGKKAKYENTIERRTIIAEMEQVIAGRIFQLVGSGASAANTVNIAVASGSVKVRRVSAARTQPNWRSRIFSSFSILFIIAVNVDDRRWR